MARPFIVDMHAHVNNKWDVCYWADLQYLGSRNGTVWGNLGAAELLLQLSVLLKLGIKEFELYNRDGQKYLTVLIYSDDMHMFCFWESGAAGWLS